MVFDPSPGEAKCLALIRQRESSNRYNVLYGGALFVGYRSFPHWAGKDGSHAAGAYQFEPETWTWISIHTKVPDFEPPSQDINALWLLRLVGPNSSVSWKASGPYPLPSELEPEINIGI